MLTQRPRRLCYRFLKRIICPASLLKDQWSSFLLHFLSCYCKNRGRSRLWYLSSLLSSLESLCWTYWDFFNRLFYCIWSSHFVMSLILTDVTCQMVDLFLLWAKLHTSYSTPYCSSITASGSQVLLKVLFLSDIFNLCISIKSHIVLPEKKVLMLKM